MRRVVARAAVSRVAPVSECGNGHISGTRHGGLARHV